MVGNGWGDYPVSRFMGECILGVIVFGWILWPMCLVQLIGPLNLPSAIFASLTWIEGVQAFGGFGIFRWLCRKYVR